MVTIDLFNLRGSYVKTIVSRETLEKIKSYLISYNFKFEYLEDLNTFEIRTKISRLKLLTRLLND